MKSLIKLSSILLAIALSSGALTLDEAIERGLAANSQVSMAEHETDAARESARTALTNLFPRASANASYTRLDETPTMTMPPEFGGMTIPMGQQDNYKLTVGVQQPIFMGGKIVNGYRAALDGARIQEENLRQTRNSTATSIAQAYFGVVKAELFMNSMNQARERMNGHLAVIEGMFSEGLIARNDLLKTRVASSEIDLMTIRARNAVKAARLGLNFLLNYPSDTLLILDPDTVVADIAWPPLDAGLDYGLEYRPDIRMLELRLDAAKAGERISWGAFSPDIVGMFNWSYQKPNRANEKEFYDSWSATVAASWPILSFGERIFGVRKAKAQRREAAEGLDMVRRAAEMEIRNLHNSLEEASQALDVSRVKLEQAKEGYRVAEAEFSTGMAANTDVLDANSSLIQAQAEYVSAIADLKIAVVKYGAAIGSIPKE